MANILTEQSFDRLANPIREVAERFELFVIERMAQIAITLSNNPNADVGVSIRAIWQEFYDEVEPLLDEATATAYRRGIEKATKGEVVTGFAGAALFASALPSQISPVSARILKDYPTHHTMYSVYQSEARSAFRRTQLPVVRDVQGKVRELTILASDSAYLQAEPLTRRQLAQGIMNRFADEGVTGIIYENGRRMPIDSYSDMVARTQTGNAARQASLNRIQEEGRDLVQISVHFPCSDICEPLQGKVYSISGTSSRYPSLQGAIGEGLYHPNCKHFQSEYIEGVSELPDPDISVTQNRQQYMAQEEQRKNERYIRNWKRRQSASLTPEEARKAKDKVAQWQAKQRDLLNNNNFLRRRYDREQI